MNSSPCDKLFKDELVKTSPISIPANAKVKIEQKTAGYKQAKYQWTEGDYKYTARWHTQTPRAPKNQGNSWVVERTRKGIGHGPNARPRKTEILVGKAKNGSSKWIDKKEWNKAIAANKVGKATKEQKEMLKNGHWKTKK